MCSRKRLPCDEPSGLTGHCGDRKSIQDGVSGQNSGQFSWKPIMHLFQNRNPQYQSVLTQIWPT